MRTGPAREKYEVVAEINMIPFIDIALVLLIIFMVMTPYLVKEQIKINPPKVKTKGMDVNKRELVQINVTRDGAYYINGEAVPADSIDAVANGKQ